ncbi:ABC transporter, ATP-binding protein [Synechococcus sp. PCC 7335]|uniref:ABC transporter ATP-binding protein n=1 Tax=Synechococcus sp. (strain ATCC 29403 / PCC 7335) TaxID=91464 RepID=UPI00017EB4D9|nr:ABC transporter ATP-binding protein [Synechococcus sp. PCC 7335]EDX86211.1 ABC transporter, ATP-binding protein [Synechococcus sp. PCC 7335]
MTFTHILRYLTTNSKISAIAQKLSSSIAIFKNMPRLFRLVWSATPLFLLISVVLTLTSSLLPAAQIYISKLIVDQVVILVEAGVAVGVMVQALLPLVGAGFSLLVLQAILQQLDSYTTQVMSDRFLLYANTKMLEQATRLDLAHYESSEFHDILNRAQQSGSSYPMRVLRLSLTLLGQVTRLVGLLALLLRFNSLVFVLLLLSALPTFWVSVRFSERRFWMTRRQTPSRRLADYFGAVLTEPKYVKEVRLFNLGNHLVEQYHSIRDEFNRESQVIARRQSLAQVSIEMVAAIAFYSAYALVLWEAIRGLVTIGDLALYAGTFQQAQSATQGILTAIATLYEFNLYVSQYFEFLDLAPQVTSPRKPKSFPTPLKEGLVLQDVYFTYPGSEQPTLKDISLTVAPTECIALVGLNGSGKTTLLKLLTRLYDIDRGLITLDDIPLSAFRLSDLRRNIGVLFQDFARYALSAQDNIGFGDLPNRDNSQQVFRAANEAGADPVINELAHGYDTVLGKMFTGGVDLSGGQWQKIGLARAFMSQAQVLILDEPTAAVDAIAEHDLFERFRQLTRGKMTFLVSHRFSTVRMADRIVVLEKGEIIETGTHEQLMKKQGRYEEMFRLQAESYTTV